MPCIVLNAQRDPNSGVTGVELITSLSATALHTQCEFLFNDYEKILLGLEVQHYGIGADERWFRLQFVVAAAKDVSSLSESMLKFLTAPVRDTIKWSGLNLNDAPSTSADKTLLSGGSAADGSMSAREIAAVGMIRLRNAQEILLGNECIRAAEEIEKQCGELNEAHLLMLAEKYGLKSGSWMWFSTRSSSDATTYEGDAPWNVKTRESFRKVMESYFTGALSKLEYVFKIVYRRNTNGSLMIRVYNNKCDYLKFALEDSSLKNADLLQRDEEVRETLKELEVLLEGRRFRLCYKYFLKTVLGINQFTRKAQIAFYNKGIGFDDSGPNQHYGNRGRGGGNRGFGYRGRGTGERGTYRGARGRGGSSYQQGYGRSNAETSSTAAAESSKGTAGARAPVDATSGGM